MYTARRNIILYAYYYGRVHTTYRYFVLVFRTLRCTITILSFNQIRFFRLFHNIIIYLSRCCCFTCIIIYYYWRDWWLIFRHTYRICRCNRLCAFVSFEDRRSTGISYWLPGTTSPSAPLHTGSWSRIQLSRSWVPVHRVRTPIVQFVRLCRSAVRLLWKKSNKNY